MGFHSSTISFGMKLATIGIPPMNKSPISMIHSYILQFTRGFSSNLQSGVAYDTMIVDWVSLLGKKIDLSMNGSLKKKCESM